MTAPRSAPQVVVIGALLWDVIGRREGALTVGADRPGRIVTRPGGVALNVAAALAARGVGVALLGHLGRDGAGRRLRAACRAAGIDMAHVLVDDHPTGRYMAIEAEGRLFAALADAEGLERAGERVLAPLLDGGLADPARPWRGPAVVDGNLPAGVLARIAARDGPLAQADLRIVPASGGKARRLAETRGRARLTLYLNLDEANLLLPAPAPDAPAAARGLVERGFGRAIVTDGPREACDAGPAHTHVATPPAVTPRRVTGAGDTLLAAHLAAELAGAPPATALQSALDAAAAHVASRDELP